MTQQSSRYSRYYSYIKPFTNLPIVKNYGSAIFTVLTLTIFIFFAIKPTIETIVVLRKKLADSSQVLEQVTKKVENLSLGKENYDRLDQSIKTKIQTAIPDNISLKLLIQSLEQAALQNQASISALQIQPITLEAKENNTLGSLEEVGFVFNTEGKYQNLVSLLQQIKSSARLISIENVVLNKLEEGGELVMSLTGKAYYIR